MKINRKVQKVGVIGSGIVIGLLIISKTFNIPILSTAVSNVLYPFEKGINKVAEVTSDFFQRFKTVDDLIAENEALKKQIDKLQYENTLLPQYEDKNNNLNALLDMKKRFIEYEGTGANVIARDYGNWNKIYTIDKGSNSNVQSNSVVLADGGLVGYVNEASYFSAKVVPIIDSHSAVSAQVVRTGDVGVLKGKVELANSSLCLLEINGESEIMKGDQIVTSYLSDIYPPGILIGTVEQVVENDNKLVSYAYIKPIVDFDHLDQVLVINNESDE